MNKYLVCMILPAAFSLAPYSAMAAESNHDNCGGTTTVRVEGMGTVNEATLQQHINGTQDRLANHSTLGYWASEREAKRHMNHMQAAMTQLHDQMVGNGCTGAAHGASLDTRISLLEKRAGAR